MLKPRPNLDFDPEAVPRRLPGRPGSILVHKVDAAVTVLLRLRDVVVLTNEFGAYVGIPRVTVLVQADDPVHSRDVPYDGPAAANVMYPRESHLWISHQFYLNRRQPFEPLGNDDTIIDTARSLRERHSECQERMAMRRAPVVDDR